MESKVESMNMFLKERLDRVTVPASILPQPKRWPIYIINSFWVSTGRECLAHHTTEMEQLRSIAPEPVLALPAPAGDDEEAKTRGRKSRVQIHPHDDSQAREMRVRAICEKKGDARAAHGAKATSEWG
jgi:hypothetical protein